MAILNVPSQYATISAAFTAASSGDDIVVDGGTHGAIDFPASKTDLRVRAKRGTTPISTGTGALLTMGSGGGNCVVSGFRFVKTGTGTGGTITDISRNFRVEDCIFDFSAWAPASAPAYVIRIRAANTGSSFLPGMRRCKVLGHSGNTPTVWFSTISTSSASRILVEGCVFDGLRSTSYLFEDGSGSPAGNLVFRNNTFLSCTSDRTIMNLESTGTVESGGVRIYNNVFYNHTFSGGSGYMLVANGAGTHYIGKNIIHNTNGYTTNLASPDEGTNSVVDPLLDAEGRPTSASSPCYEAGVTASGDGERRVWLGYGRRSFYVTPDLGAFPVARGQKSALYRKTPNADILSSVTANVAAHGDITPAASRDTYQSPWDTALALEQALTSNASRGYGPLEIWYDEENDRYRATSYLDTFNLSITGASAKVFGAASETGISDTG